MLIPLVYGLEECQREEAPGNIPCYLVTGWTPPNACSSYSVSVFGSNGTYLYSQTMGDVGNAGRCNITFNQTNLDQYYANSTIDTWNVKVNLEDEMIGGGVIIFLILLNAALFFIPFKVQFSPNEAANHVMKYMTWILSWVILAFNTTILAELADNAGLGITHELFVFQWFFLKGIYVLMLILFIKMLKMVFTIVKEDKTRVRMGEDG